MTNADEATGIVVEVIDGVAIVRLANPPVNALTSTTWRDLAESIRRIDSDLSVGAIVLTGHPGRLFSAGQDTKELADGASASAVGEAMAQALSALAESAVPSVAAVHGAAIGGGLLLTCLTDCVVCTPSTAFSLPEIKLGIVGGYSFLVNRIPRNEARRIALSGEPLTGRRAYELGFVQRTVDADADVVGAAVEIARSFAPFARLATGVQPRRVFDTVEHVGPIEGFELERRSGT